MKFTINQLSEYTKVILKPEELANSLRTHLGEVEEFTDLSLKYKGIVLATVVEVKKHPSKEHLQIVKVNIGDKSIQVIAGGPQLNIGDRVAYIPVGAQIPNNLHPERGETVQKMIVDGIESEGVLPSGKELDISENHTKVWTVKTDKKDGTPISEILTMNDYLLDIENKALTNRADCFGIIGIARDIAGIQGLSFSTPEWFKTTVGEKTEAFQENSVLKVENKLPELCKRYTAVVIDNVRIKESPLWLQTYLAKLGIRSINNIVDITNYLMVVTGQPLHAFDYDKVVKTDPSNPSKANIVIRSRKEPKEKITTLDGKERIINEEAILICNSENPIALGGIMGGESTEIDENTTKIIIESANFDYIAIRKTSNKQGLFTDAVTRFARGQDPNKCKTVLQKAIELTEELAEGTVLDNIVDIYTSPRLPRRLTISLNKTRKFLALDISNEQIQTVLQNVELKNKLIDEDTLEIDIPTFRNDLQIAEDIYEEIARLYGYDKITLSLPQRTIAPTPTNKMINLKMRVSEILRGVGVTELISYLFVGKDLYDKFGLTLQDAYQLINPLSPELEYIRTSLLPSMLEKVQQNLNKGYNTVSFYEFNQVFNKHDFNNQTRLPIPHKHLALSYSTNNKTKLIAYYQVKFFVDTLVQKLDLPQIQYKNISEVAALPYKYQLILPLFDKNRRAVITYTLDDQEYILGIIGEPQINTQLPEHTAVAEIDLETLLLGTDLEKYYQDPSKYPPIKRDLCFQFEENTPYEVVYNHLQSFLNSLSTIYTELSLKDIYKNSEEKSIQYTFGITIQGQNKALTKEKSNQIFEQIIQSVQEIGGKLKK